MHLFLLHHPEPYRQHLLGRAIVSYAELVVEGLSGRIACATPSANGIA
jgi:hypothetical protein